MLALLWLVAAACEDAEGCDPAYEDAVCLLQVQRFLEKDEGGAPSVEAEDPGGAEPGLEWSLLKEALVQDRQTVRAEQAGGAALPLTAAQKQQLLDAHNALRRREGASGMARMAWSDAVAATAQVWANQCVWEHSTPQNVRKFAECGGAVGCSSGGENLHVTSAGPDRASLVQGVQDWWDEKVDWTFGDGTYQSSYCKPGRMCGHYTQVVWASSARLGCARSDCTNRMTVGGSPMRTYLVCQYAPGGNMMGGTMYTAGPVCSACPSGSSCCEQGLCVGSAAPLTSGVTLSACNGGQAVRGARGQGLDVRSHSLFRNLGPYVAVDVQPGPSGWVATLRWQCSDASCQEGQNWPEMPVGRCAGNDWFKVDYEGTLPVPPGVLQSQEACPSDDGLGGAAGGSAGGGSAGGGAAGGAGSGSAGGGSAGSGSAGSGSAGGAGSSSADTATAVRAMGELKDPLSKVLEALKDGVRQLKRLSRGSRSRGSRDSRGSRGSRGSSRRRRRRRSGRSSRSSRSRGRGA